MTLAEYWHYEKTIEAFPLGKPVDGRHRYGMTPEQAAFYNLIVKRYGKSKLPFAIGTRQYAKAMCYASASTLHYLVDNLIARGWLERVSTGRYRFVHPVMKFKERG